MSWDPLWPDPDFCAGGQSTLRMLYDLVPAAEDADLLEEAIDADFRDHWLRTLDEIWPDDDPPDPAEDCRSEPLNTEQVIALLQRTLGATVIDEYGPAPDLTWE